MAGKIPLKATLMFWLDKGKGQIEKAFECLKENPVPCLHTAKINASELLLTSKGHKMDNATS